MKSLPENWKDEHDHFIVYMRNSPTVFPCFTSLEHIWQNLQDTFPYLGSIDYEAFCTREEQLQDGAMQILMDIWDLMYWWAHNHPWNPFIESGNIYIDGIPHTAGPPLGISVDGIGTETIEQTREPPWNSGLSSPADAAKFAISATLPESNTGSSTTGKAAAVTKVHGEYQGGIGVDEPGNKDGADRLLRRMPEEDSGTMKARRTLGLLKREEDSQKVT